MNFDKTRHHAAGVLKTPVPAARGAKRRLRTAVFLFAGILLAVLIASVNFYTASLASSRNPNNAASSNRQQHKGVSAKSSGTTNSRWFAAPLSPLTPVADTVGTYQVVNGACTNTAKTSFALGQDVCVKGSAELGPGYPVTVLAVEGTDGTAVSIVDVNTDPQELIFTLPSTTTSVVNGLVVDNRGTWRASVHGRFDFSSRFAAFFSVTDPNNAAADLVVSNSSTATDTIAPGDTASFSVFVTNDGPDTASDVHVTQNVPSNMTFDSVTAGSGAAFSCAESNGVVDCTPTAAGGNMTSGASSLFTLNYTVDSGAPNAILTTEVDVASDTTDPHPESNASSTRVEIRATGSSPATCVLSCPQNMTVTATTSQNNTNGAIVNFGVESSGDCGTVTSTPASGSFFPVGTTTVNTSSGTGGGSCSFTVTVVETAAPTITCAADQNEQTSGSSQEATVTVNTPSYTGTNVVLTGVRSDNRSLSDGYPIGTTTITWTARECNDAPDCNDPTGRYASCNQKIIVTSPDVPTISCPSNKTFPASDCAGKTLTSADIGTPTATGSNVTVSGQRSDNLALYDDPYPVGNTAITWTAVDDGGRQASCTQVITITSAGGADNVPPTITAPPNVSVTTSSCSRVVSEDEIGTPEASDNCGTPTVTRSGVPAGNVFPTGTTTITYTATDPAGNTAVATQTVTVSESPAINPTVVAPADSSAFADANCQAPVPNYAAGSTASDNCPGVTVSQSPAAGTLVGYGPHTVTVTATDRSGNTATDDVVFTVNDNTAPSITAPADSAANADSNCQAPVPDYRPATTASDNCGTPTLTQSPAPGTLVGFGPHTVTVTANDGHGNTASDDVVFTVNDATPPTITAPADSSAFADGNCQAPVPDYRPGTTAADNCGTVTLTQSPAPGTLVGYGPHTVTVTANDGHGNTASDDVVFTVNDNTPPVFTSCPSNIVLEPTCPSGAIATYATPTATDNCGATVTRTAGGASGTVFPIGTTTVTHVADDGHGNTATCTFTVTVKSVNQTILDMEAYINSLSNLSGTQKQGLNAKLEAARTAPNTTVACNKLGDFITQVNAYINNGTLTSAQGNALLSSANHVRNTIGCTSLPCS